MAHSIKNISYRLATFTTCEPAKTVDSIETAHAELLAAKNQNRKGYFKFCDTGSNVFVEYTNGEIDIFTFLWVNSVITICNS